MAKPKGQQFKQDAVQYYQDHKDLGVRGCAVNLGIGYSTLTKWIKEFKESGNVSFRGSGSYSSDEQNEITRLKRELRNTQDAHAKEDVQQYMDGTAGSGINARAKYLMKYKVEIVPSRRTP